MSEQGSHSKTSIKCYILKNGEQEVIQSFHLKFSYAIQELKNSLLNIATLKLYSEVVKASSISQGFPPNYSYCG